MTGKRFSAHFTWLYFILGVFCLITAGVFMERAALIPIVPSFFLRGLLYGLLGIFLLLMFGSSRKNSGIDESF